MEYHFISIERQMQLSKDNKKLRATNSRLHARIQKLESAIRTHRGSGGTDESDEILYLALGDNEREVETKVISNDSKN